MFPDSAASSSPSPHLLCSNYLEYISWSINKPTLFCFHTFAGAIPSNWNVTPTLSPTGKILQDPDQMSLPHVIPPLVTPEEITVTFSLSSHNKAWLMLRDITYHFFKS